MRREGEFRLRQPNNKYQVGRGVVGDSARSHLFTIF